GLSPVVVVLYFFVFQAEDGIRDRNVTGVQTCALPISRGQGGQRHLVRLGGRRSVRGSRRLQPGTRAAEVLPLNRSRGRTHPGGRSEERRVGKASKGREAGVQIRLTKRNVGSGIK